MVDCIEEDGTWTLTLNETKQNAITPVGLVLSLLVFGILRVAGVPYLSPPFYVLIFLLIVLGGQYYFRWRNTPYSSIQFWKITRAYYQFSMDSQFLTLSVLDENRQLRIPLNSIYGFFVRERISINVAGGPKGNLKYSIESITFGQPEQVLWVGGEYSVALFLKQELERARSALAAEPGRIERFCRAIQSGQIEDIEQFLDEGHDVNSVFFGTTALISSIRANQALVTRRLLERGACVDIRNFWDESPLMNAAELGNNEMVALLMDPGAGCNEVNYAGRTPLMYATLAGHKETVELLLKRGAQIDMEDHKGNSAFVYAEKAFDFDIIELISPPDRNTTIHINEDYQPGLVKEWIHRMRDVNQFNEVNKHTARFSEQANSFFLLPLFLFVFAFYEASIWWSFPVYIIKARSELISNHRKRFRWTLVGVLIIVYLAGLIYIGSRGVAYLMAGVALLHYCVKIIYTLPAPILLVAQIRQAMRGVFSVRRKRVYRKSGSIAPAAIMDNPLSFVADIFFKERSYNSPPVAYFNHNKKYIFWLVVSTVNIGILILVVALSFTIALKKGMAVASLPPSVMPPLNNQLIVDAIKYISILSAASVAVSLMLLRVLKKLRVYRIKNVQFDLNLYARTLGKWIESDELTDQPFCLYLHSFKASERLVALGANMETSLAYSFHDSLPVVAFGIPGKLGPGKVRVDENNWRNKIGPFLQAASVILIIPNHTEGVLWEIEYIKAHQLLDKVVFIMPPEQSYESGMFSEEWTRVVQVLKARDIALPAHFVNGQLLSFDNNGILKGYTPLENLYREPERHISYFVQPDVDDGMDDHFRSDHWEMYG